MTAPTYCTTCEQTVHPTYPHSCFSAAAQRAHRDAERAVIEAAKAWKEVEPLAYHMEKKQDAEMALARAVATLRALEGEDA
jgi:hypothetical protein